MPSLAVLTPCSVTRLPQSIVRIEASEVFVVGVCMSLRLIGTAVLMVGSCERSVALAAAEKGAFAAMREGDDEVIGRGILDDMIG